MFYYWALSSMQAYSFNLWSLGGGLSPVPRHGWCLALAIELQESAERQQGGGGGTGPTLGVPKVQMPSENITQTIFNLDCIFTSSSNSDQRLIWL